MKLSTKCMQFVGSVAAAMLLVSTSAGAEVTPRTGKSGRAVGQARNAVFASSAQLSQLILPEGITSRADHLYVGTYNVFAPQDSRIFVFQAQTGKLLNTIGGNPGEELISAGALLGLTIDRATGDLYAANNFTGEIVRVQSPESAHPRVSLFGTLPQAGAGPEDLNFGPAGRLYSSDSNLGLVWSFDPAGGDAILEIGPSGSGARHSDNGLFASAVGGLSPNGIVFSADNRRLFVANTYADSINVFDVGADGHVDSDGRLFAQNVNHDLIDYPTGFEGVILPDTRYGASAATALNGPDGLALDEDGNIWAASIFGDNLTVIDSNDGHVLRTVGSSATFASAPGLLNSPAGMTFVGREVYNTNLGIFTDGSNGNANLPFTVTRQAAGVKGFGGNGNH
jgi:sugar lactone lactonase YvrE